MAWIESHQAVGEHPKTKKLARLLGVSLPTAVGHLHFFWWWALDYAPSGSLKKYDKFDIADAVRWDGDPKQLLDALVDSGYIERKNGNLYIHDWMEYAGKLLEKRAKDRDRKRKAAETAAASIGFPMDFQRNDDGTAEETDGECEESAEKEPEVAGNQPTNHIQTNLFSGGGDTRTRAHAREELEKYLQSRGDDPSVMFGVTDQLVEEAAQFTDELFDTFTARKPTKLDVNRVLLHILEQTHDTATDTWTAELAKTKKEMLMYAFEAAASAGKGGDWNYIAGVFGRMARRGIVDLTSAELHEIEREEAKCG